MDMEMEDQPHNKPPHPNPSSTVAILAVSAFLIALVIGISLAIVFGVSRHPPPAQPDSIRLVCNVTRYPDSCFATISSIDSSPDPDPELILHLSIRVCLKQAIASQTVSSSVSEECAELFEDARSRIADSLEAMGGDGRVGLTEDRINDVQTWLSAALTDQETCLDGLEEMNKSSSSSTKLEEFKVNAQKLKEYLSNSLAIAANIHPLLHRFGLHLH